MDFRLILFAFWFLRLNPLSTFFYHCRSQNTLNKNEPYIFKYLHGVGTLYSKKTPVSKWNEEIRSYSIEPLKILSFQKKEEVGEMNN